MWRGPGQSCSEGGFVWPEGAVSSKGLLAQPGTSCSTRWGGGITLERNHGDSLVI